MPALLRDAVALLRDTWTFFRAHLRWLLLFLAALVVLALVMVPHDAEWLAWLTGAQTDRGLAAARSLTLWGDYHTGSLLLAASVLVVGLVLRRPALRRAALASILAASLAGLTANVFRGLLGRPRPIASVPDGLYGPTFQFRLQGSPSAHAATSVGSAAALVVTVPIVGVPALVAACGVVWSRLYLRHHHPTDVAIGGSLGVLFGVVLGLAARRRRDDAPAASPESP